MNLKEHTRWLQDNGEAKRLDYNLNEDSIVIDVGGYKGEWAAKIHNKYGCYIHIYEPVKSFYEQIVDKFAGNNKIFVYNYGLGGSTREEYISLDEDASSTEVMKVQNLFDGGAHEKIQINNIFAELYDLKLLEIDLMKINIEGGEYELLEEMIDTGVIERFGNIQIQFHDFVTDAEKKRDAIIERLKETYCCEFCYEFVWESWSKI